MSELIIILITILVFIVVSGAALISICIYNIHKEHKRWESIDREMDLYFDDLTGPSK